MKHIGRIDIGSDSEIVGKTKRTDLYRTSFTIWYGRDLESLKSLTVTANSVNEAFVWAKGLELLSNALKQGRNLVSLGRTQLPTDAKNVRVSHKRANLLNKSSSITAASLLKQYTKCKKMLQKCVDFVMIKSNYRTIANAGQFEKVKLILEELDDRLVDIQYRLWLISTEKISNYHLSLSNHQLSLCNADLDALKEKLLAIISK